MDFLFPPSSLLPLAQHEDLMAVKGLGSRKPRALFSRSLHCLSPALDWYWFHPLLKPQLGSRGAPPPPGSMEGGPSTSVCTSAPLTSQPARIGKRNPGLRLGYQTQSALITTYFICPSLCKCLLYLLRNSSFSLAKVHILVFLALTMQMFILPL